MFVFAINSCSKKEAPGQALLEKRANHIIRTTPFWERYNNIKIESRTYPAPKELIEYLLIDNKIQEIRQNPQHYKNLRKPLHHLKRIHIDKSFVLVFSVDENRKHITIEDYDHHDNIYSE